MAASEGDSIVYQMNQHVGKPLSKYTPVEAYGMVAQWLKLADYVKIESNHDRLALCEFGLKRPELLKDTRYLALFESGGDPQSLNETCALLA